MTDIRVSIDRGGTFCDVIAYVQGREPIIFKLLSSDPANYRDAPTEAIRRVLEMTSGSSIPVGSKLDASCICEYSHQPVNYGLQSSRILTAV